LLRYFRINDPYRLVALLILLLIIYLPLFIDPPAITAPEQKAMMVGQKLADGNRMYAEIIDNTGPLSAWFHALMDILFGSSLLARHIVAFIIIFFQSAFLGVIFITKRVFIENTFIPPLIFSLLYFFSFDTLALTDELLGSGVLLLAMNNLFKEIEFRTPRNETTFNLGIYLSFASLFHLPYIIFLFAILVMLFLFARTDLRKVLLLIFAFLLPHFFLLTITYLGGPVGPLVDYYYLSGLQYHKEVLVSINSLVILGAVPLFYFAISVIMLNRLARFSKYQSQLLQSIFLWIGFCFIYFLFCRDLRPQTMVVLIPALTFLFTHFLLLIRRRKFSEMNTWILLLGIVSTAYLARYDKLNVSYNDLLLKPVSGVSNRGVTVLVLGPEPGYYIGNYASTPFVNWELSKRFFEQPQYFESLTTAYTGILSAPPSLIVDKQNLMTPFLERIPELERIYRRRGDTWELQKVSN
jgi:hypothetical protein